MYLIINTADRDYIQLLLIKNSNDFKVKKIKAPFQQSEKLLAGIDRFLSANQAKLLNLKGIGVIAGPGGFTALRIGIATANALAYSLKLPIIGLNLSEFQGDQELIEVFLFKVKKAKVGGLVLPEYGADANIG